MKFIDQYNSEIINGEITYIEWLEKKVDTLNNEMEIVKMDSYEKIYKSSIEAKMNACTWRFESNK